MKNSKEKIIKKMKVFQGKRNLNDKDFAILIGCNPSAICRFYKDVRPLSPAIAKKIATIIGIKMEDFF